MHTSFNILFIVKTCYACKPNVLAYCEQSYKNTKGKHHKKVKGYNQSTL